MDPQLLRTLRELRDRGSVTAAAEALHVSPSAVSQQLGALQRRTSVPLTHKEGRALRVTAAGERVLAAGAEVFDALARVDETLADLAAEPREPVHVAAFATAAHAWFPQLAADPGLDVRLHDHDVPRAEFIALTGDVDVVVAQRAVHEEPWPDGGITVVPLLVEPLDVAVRAGHPTAGQRLTGPRLAELEWMAVHGDYPLASYVDVLAAHADGPLAVRHRLNDFPTAVALLEGSDLACLLPRYTHPGRPGALALRPVPGVRMVRHVDALVRPERLARQSVREVLERLRGLAVEASR